ncbi:hypothetical protein [Maribacter hydrothermalis]|uniref:Bulb-type lectin domain-containing protein n=1 Tax=Maribacter hydrothermalis TaxID=1836467 RepID=A0A1B7ZED7_9FLAO|nr:hypothetical protein [Maribacter hydrothermalis]APQ17442.1 hypothetical protein BTR34_08945 [Maribacter hydrothermalis]OBR41920.1 hypothetical protein A9200_00585 [Maribacter hydrothermalis]
MRNILLVLLFCILFSCAKEDAEVVMEGLGTEFKGELDWIKNFGGNQDDSAQAIIKTIDGGYAILGYTGSINGDVLTKNEEENDYWLLKLDKDFNLKWNKTYGGSKDDIGQSLAQTSDGGYILTGYAMSSDGDATNNEGFHDNWILKLNAQGVLEWESSYGFSGHDHSYDIIEATQGGYFFTGFLDITSARADGNTEKGNSLTSHGVGEFWGTKIDEDGKVQWRGYFGGTNNDRAHSVVQTNDGGYVMAGFTESNDFDISNTNGSYDFWVVKVDTFGNLLWEQSYGGEGIEVSYDIAKTADNGFVVVGNTFSTNGDILLNHGGSDMWMIKLDEDGNLIWEQTYGGSQFDLAQAVVQSKDGGFLITGNTKSDDKFSTINYGENDIWVVKTNSFGTLVWQKSFGGSGLDFGHDLLENADGSIVVIGESTSTDFQTLTSKGKADLILLKIK